MGGDACRPLKLLLNEVARQKQTLIFEATSRALV
jgi:hypothetical protein